MNIGEIKKLLSANPDELIGFLEKNGFNFSNLSKDISRQMVRKRFSLSDEQFDAVDFVFWLVYFVEKEADILISSSEVASNGRKVAIDVLVGKLNFGDKISVIEELYTAKNDPLIKIMRKIQNFRNDVAHGRFDNLNYGGYYLSNNKAKLKLIGNLRDAFLKKK